MSRTIIEVRPELHSHEAVQHHLDDLRTRLEDAMKVAAALDCHATREELEAANRTVWRASSALAWLINGLLPDEHQPTA